MCLFCCLGAPGPSSGAWLDPGPPAVPGSESQKKTGISGIFHFSVFLFFKKQKQKIRIFSFLFFENKKQKNRKSQHTQKGKSKAPLAAEDPKQLYGRPYGRPLETTGYGFGIRTSAHRPRETTGDHGRPRGTDSGSG